MERDRRCAAQVMKQFATRVRGPVLILQNPIKDFKQGRDGVGFVFKKDHCGAVQRMN